MCTSESFIQTVVFLDLQDKKMLVVKEKEVSVLTKQLQALQEEGKNDSAALEAAEQHFKAVSAGLSTNEDGEEATLAGQMMACKNDISKADTEAKQVSLAFRINIFAEGWLCFCDWKTFFFTDLIPWVLILSWISNHLFFFFLIYAQAQMTLKHAQAELKTKQAEVKKMDSGYKKDQDTLKAVKNSREKLEAELAKLNYEGTNSWLFMYLFKQESHELTYEVPFLYKPVY